MSEDIEEIKNNVNFLDIVKNTLIHRLTTPFYFYIITSFLFSNWDKILYLIYGTESIQTRTSIVQMEGIYYFTPIWHGIVIAIVMPYFSRFLEIIHLSSDVCQNWLSKERNIKTLKYEDHIDNQRHINNLNNKKRLEEYDNLLIDIEQFKNNLDSLSKKSKYAHNTYIKIAEKHSSFISVISGEISKVVNLRSALYENELALGKIKNDLHASLGQLNKNEISISDLKQYITFDIEMITDHLDVMKKLKSKEYFNHDENSKIDIEYDLDSIINDLQSLTNELDPVIFKNTTTL